MVHPAGLDNFVLEDNVWWVSDSYSELVNFFDTTILSIVAKEN